MRLAPACPLLLLLAVGCTDSPDETSGTPAPVLGVDSGNDQEVVPGCDGTIPESQLCPTPCGNWTEATQFACSHQSDMAPSPPTVGECPDYYSETVWGLDSRNVFFYDKATLAFSGAVLRGNDGLRICVGKIPSVQACGDHPPTCMADGGTDSAPE